MAPFDSASWSLGDFWSQHLREILSWICHGCKKCKTPFTASQPVASFHPLAFPRLPPLAMLRLWLRSHGACSFPCACGRCFRGAHCLLSRWPRAAGAAMFQLSGWGWHQYIFHRLPGVVPNLQGGPRHPKPVAEHPGPSVVAAARLCAGNGVPMRGRVPAEGAPRRARPDDPEDSAGHGRSPVAERDPDSGPMATAVAAARERGDGLGGSRDVLEKVCWIQAGIGTYVPWQGMEAQIPGRTSVGDGGWASVVHTCGDANSFFDQHVQQIGIWENEIRDVGMSNNYWSHVRACYIGNRTTTLAGIRFTRLAAWVWIWQTAANQWLILGSVVKCFLCIWVPGCRAILLWRNSLNSSEKMSGCLRGFRGKDVDSRWATLYHPIP